MAKAQSAMEFMLTYGWAILVVMVVGIVMWQIGVFDLGGSTTTSSSGFSTLKPIVATCKMSEDVYISGMTNGFQCMFTNPSGTSIRVWETINVTINDKYCEVMWIDVLPEFDSGEGAYVAQNCADEDGDCEGAAGDCNDMAGEGRCQTCGGIYDCLLIPADSTFFVMALSSVAAWPACDDIKPGRSYEAFIDITYDMSIGGLSVTKHDSGYIRGVQE